VGRLDGHRLSSTNHAQLSPTEQDVLWEYAKLKDTIKRVSKSCRLFLTTDSEHCPGGSREPERALTGGAADTREEDGAGVDSGKGNVNAIADDSSKRQSGRSFRRRTRMHRSSI
jgi:hypothetical protein